MDLVVTQFGSDLQNQVDGDLCTASFLRELLVPFVFKVFNSFFLDFFRFFHIGVYLVTVPLEPFFFLADVMDMVFVMENDAWETQQWMKPKYASPVACLAKTSELIRSLRDDEKVKSQEPGMRKWLRVHDESEWSLITSLICRF